MSNCPSTFSCLEESSIRRSRHLTPTSSSWLNQVERFFAFPTQRQIRRGIHRSVKALHAAINAYIEQHNAEPKPFRWTKSADDPVAERTDRDQIRCR